jgi:hypothetical protein
MRPEPVPDGRFVAAAAVGIRQTLIAPSKFCDTAAEHRI